MSTRTVEFVENEFFHIYNRGNSKQNIFLNAADFNRFIALLYLSNTTQQFNIREILKSHNDVYEAERPDRLVKIAAFCLMNNHYHLILSPIVESGISKFMLKLATAYSMYFNTKYERTGSLFEGKFKAKHIDSDEYLKYLFSYVHLNPVAKQNRSEILIPNYSETFFTKAKQYNYSTLSDYVLTPSPRQGLGLIDTEVYKMYFETEADVKRELFDWLQYEEPALGKA